MFTKLLILSGVMISISAIFLGITILLKVNGRFPQTHAGHNKEMQKRGITCAQDTSIGCKPSGDLTNCCTCGQSFSEKK
jgi:hypothetical protein